MWKIAPVLLLFLSSLLASAETDAEKSSFDAQIEQAEALAQEGSYEKALGCIRSLSPDEQLTPYERDRLAYIQADVTLRNLASTNQSDQKLIQDQRDILIELAAKLKKEETTARPPELWAQIQRSLGDSWWANDDLRNWGKAWPHFQKALDWWAASTDLDTARERYLAIMTQLVDWPNGLPGQRRVNYYSGWRQAQVPVGYLENAIRLAQTPGGKARFNFALANALSNQGNGYQQLRRIELLQTVVAQGKDTEYYDIGLFALATVEAQQGASHYDENGNWITKPDFEEALKYYRQILDQYSEGESPVWREAKRQVEQITGKELAVIVQNNFLPEVPLSFTVRTRNISGLRAEVFSVSMDEIAFPGSESDQESSNWWERVNLSGKEPVWSYHGELAKEYEVFNQEVRLPKGLPKGLYVVRASGEGESTYGWLLVTRAALVTKTGRDNLHAWAIQAESGQPLEGAKLRAWFTREQNNRRTWQSANGETDEDGLAALPFPTSEDYWQWMLFAETEEGPAMLQQYWHRYRSEDVQWRVYAFTDRPAYRPEDTVHWKFSARIRQSLSAYSVPAGETLKWRIVDPRGSEVAKGEASLNDYGSTWGDLPLTKDMPLGMFRVEFRHGNNWIGSEELFRLEEYKLPEFKVTVSTEGPDGEPQTAFRLGDRVPVTVQADYYFGGAVANAQVEVVVRQKQFYMWWQPIRPYAWYYDQQSRWRGYYGPGQEVQRETLTTDDTGRATFTIETPAGNRQDLEYTVEARVVDESRREIIGNASIRVTRQPYFVFLQPQRQLYRPGEEARIDIKSLNANRDPVPATGRLIVTREEWQQIWIGPKGEEITGQEYRRRQRSTGLFSRHFEPSEWRLMRQGYDVEEISSQTITTDKDGAATFSFEVPKAGYYKFSWFSQAEDGYPIKADTAVWACDETTLDVGFQGGLKLIFDADSFRAGQSAPVMINAPSAGRAVWFTVETDGLLESRIVRMEGTVKLLNLDVTDAWVPNVFLAASMFQDYTLYQDNQEAVVPPVDQFLDVTITPNSDLYQPRDTGTLTVETRDHDGNPVSAEVALSLFDEAVLYIQPQIAPDPREFFYGQKRGNSVQTYSSVYDRSFWTPAMEESRRRAGARNERELKAGAAYRDGRDQDMYLGYAASESVSTAAYAPAPAAAPVMARSRGIVAGKLVAGAELAMDFAGAAVAGEEPAVVVRSDFRATVFWQPNVMTGPDGTATVDVTFPDSLTTWQAEARALALPGKVGQASAQMKTKLPLIARLQMPRFLVTGDEVTLSGVINNNTDTDMQVEVSLAQDGEALELGSATQSLTVPANGSSRANFTARAVNPGEPKLTLTAKGTQYADAMEKPLPVFEHGIDKFLAQSGKMTTGTLTVPFDMPAFRPEGASFEIYATPSLAATMLDALPYLAGYPYGCVEQTMSRFLPAVVVSKTLTDLGLSEEDVVERAFGGKEGRQAGDGGDNLYDLKKMVGDGLARLYDFQHGDGGWGWWKGGDSDAFMSAYVVWGLTLCEQSGVTVRNGVLDRGREFLDKRLVETENQPDLAAWMLHALASRFEGNDNPAPTRFEAKAFAELWKSKEQLNAYTRALLTLAAVNLGFEEEAATLARNLQNGVIVDDAPQGSIIAPGNPRNTAELATAHWGNDGIYYRWSDGGVEATAFAVKALLAAHGDKALSDKAVNWLVQNRRGAQWSNTRDTAITILALNDFLKQSGELDAAIDYTIALNGETVATESVPAGHGPLAPSRFTVDVSKLNEGANTITFARQSGTAPLYFSARANFFTLEDPITPAGNVVFVQRDFYRIRPVPTLLDGYAEEKTQIQSGAEVQSGDRVEVVLVVQAKNNLEYLVFEDLKAAGFEATELQSGASLYAKEVRVLHDADGNIALPAEDAKDRYVGRQRWVYQELRDRKIASFVDKLPEGYWELRYTLRAETPGTFSALPVLGHAMYVPEIRANSAEFKVTVE